MKRPGVPALCTAVFLVLAFVLPGAGCHRRPEILEVRMAYEHPVVTLDPHAHDDAVTRSILAAVFEPLVCLGPDLEVRPCLAERWTTPAPTLWRFKVREGVLFHDGRQLRRDDVLASLLRAWKSKGSAIGSYLSSVVAISLAGDEPCTVEIRTAEPAPLLLSRLAMIPIVPTDFDEQRPVGTGPYRLGRRVSPSDLILERWDRYWGRSGNFDRVRILGIPPGERLRRLITEGSVDVVTTVSASFIASVSSAKDWYVERTPALATTLLALNVLRWPLSDPRVRQAIDLAIDRKRLVEEAYPDQDVSPARSLIPVEVFGYCEAGSVPAPDPDRARQLLREAGIPQGTTLTIESSNTPPAVLDSLSASLLWIGIKVEFQDYPWSILYRRMLNGQSPAQIFGWNFPLADASDFFESCVHSRDLVEHLGIQNSSRYSNAQVDRWIDGFSRESSTSRRLELIRKILIRLGRDRPYLPLYHRKHLLLVRKPFAVPRRAGSWVLPQEVYVKGDGP